jgi:hypothetical protein
MNTQMKNSTVERFNAIRWHDSKLVALCFYRAEEEDRVKISLELLGPSGSLMPAEIIFKESSYIEADVYLQAKSMCSDDISGAECLESSDWKNEVSKPGPYDVIQGNRGLNQFLHFSISMCAPGGTINLLARDFSLQMKAAG